MAISLEAKNKPLGTTCNLDYSHRSAPQHPRKLKMLDVKLRAPPEATEEPQAKRAKRKSKKA